MRPLRTCDFCGSDAVGTFEIVPHELDPTDAEQRRVVLCEGCSERLEGLLEPLLDRLGAEASKSTTTGSPDATGTPTDETSTEAPSDDPSTAFVPAETATEPVPDTVDAADRSGSEITGEAEAIDRSGSEITVRRDQPDRDPETNRFGDADRDPNAARSGADGNPDTEESGDGEAADADRPSAGDRHRPPAAYNNVIRLLRNREFPMERTAVESLAAGAYDLESHEVDAILEYAIETDDLAADGPLLRRS